ncbi:MAG: hypothetical protein L6V93_18920 [Clostridiales bacterium]|nr:MAG: hypothetical protein L6V93_18920 [Clostridiales bacterium]
MENYKRRRYENRHKKPCRGKKFGTENVKVAANLPYYITTPIIMMLFGKQGEIQKA